MKAQVPCLLFATEENAARRPVGGAGEGSAAWLANEWSKGGLRGTDRTYRRWVEHGQRAAWARRAPPPLP
jgi:hypothetical protein